MFVIRAINVLDKSLPPKVKEFKDVFNKEKDVAKLRGANGAEHAINLELSKKPPFRPLYNLSTSELIVLREYLNLALANRWIRRSISEASALILFVPKKDSSLRLYIDY